MHVVTARALACLRNGLGGLTERDGDDAYAIRVAERGGLDRQPRPRHVDEEQLTLFHYDGANHQQPVGQRHVDLLVERLAGVDDLDVRKVREPHDLRQQLEGRRDHGLRGDDGRQHRNDHAKVEAARRHRVEEGVREGRLRLVGRDVGGLPGVREEQARVRKHGLDAGKGQQQAAERLPPLAPVAHEVRKSEVGAERLQHAVVVDREVVYATTQIEEQPDGYNRRKRRADLGGSEGLDQEEHHQDRARYAHNGRRPQVGIGHLDPLDGAEDRLRRRQDAVGHDHGNSQHADELKRELASLG
ncbi:hypothetical protein TOPH_05618, partial [Tolypocladium ophioglossoides CBS 100239]